MPDHIELFYDLGSPYSYLAVTQIDRLRKLTGVPVRLRAFLVGGVFKSVGNHMPASVPAKARWMLTDLETWARRYGVPWTWSPHFPFNTLRGQRMLVWLEGRDAEAAERLTHVLFRRLWGEGADPNDPGTWTSAIEEAGLGDLVAELFAAPDDPAVKETLKQVTAEAVERGAFGAPSLFWGDELYWGNDRLEILAWRLSEGT